MKLFADDCNNFRSLKRFYNNIFDPTKEDEAIDISPASCSGILLSESIWKIDVAYETG